MVSSSRSKAYFQLRARWQHGNKRVFKREEINLSECWDQFVDIMYSVERWWLMELSLHPDFSFSLFTLHIHIRVCCATHTVPCHVPTGKLTPKTVVNCSTLIVWNIRAWNNVIALYHFPSREKTIKTTQYSKTLEFSTVSILAAYQPLTPSDILVWEDS